MEDTVRYRIVILMNLCNVSPFSEFSERDPKFQWLSLNGTDIMDSYPVNSFVVSFQGII